MLQIDDEGKLIEFELQEKIRLAEQRRQILEFTDKVKNFLYQYYLPVSNPKDAELHFTTSQIFEQCQELFPSLSYSPTEVTLWLNAGGYTFFDYGEFKFEWLFKKK